MPLDYSALLYDPVYAEIGVPAAFNGAAITVIDDTRPKILPAGSAEVRSVGPGAFVRIPELEENGIVRDDWLNAELSFNGRLWTVRSYELRGSPNGEDVGEVRFLLKAAEAPLPPSPPDWVPANARIHIDFLGGTPQGRAWSNGTQVAINTLLGSDPNTENGWGISVYNPAYLNVHGYQIPEDAVEVLPLVAFIGDAKTKALEGATIVVQAMANSSHPSELVPLGTINLVLLSADGADALEIDLGYPVHGASAYSWGGDPPLDLSISSILNETNGELNKIACTIVLARVDIAVNGSTAQTGSVDDTIRPSGNPLVAAALNCNTTQAIQSITIYDPLPTTAGLSELSALDG